MSSCKDLSKKILIPLDFLLLIGGILLLVFGIKYNIGALIGVGAASLAVTMFLSCYILICLLN